MMISVVMAAHGRAENLIESLNSVFRSNYDQIECILVLDGSIDPKVHSVVSSLGLREDRLIIAEVQRAGLTRALCTGCAMARGDSIARLDAGDVMTFDRLQRQSAILRRNPDCILVTSDVEVCGPQWEPLRVKQCHPPMLLPQRVDNCPPEQGLSIDIPHHASVMFRRSAYKAVGGYRTEFYFGQDWDLWYRLAEQGSFFHIPHVLTRVRLFPEAISSRHWREQRKIALISKACYQARRGGETESALLERAAVIQPQAHRDTRPTPWWTFSRSRAEGNYFIAESLRRNTDSRCRRYFAAALLAQPWRPRFWLRAVQSLWIARAR
jgi:glycosyltransferase involved in cell wall biosynthesis